MQVKKETIRASIIAMFLLSIAAIGAQLQEVKDVKGEAKKLSWRARHEGKKQEKLKRKYGVVPPEQYNATYLMDNLLSHDAALNMTKLAGGAENFLHILRRIQTPEAFVCPDAMPGMSACWSPVGDHFVVYKNGGFLTMYRACDWQQVWSSGPVNIMNVAWRPDGKGLAFAKSNQVIGVWDEQTNTVKDIAVGSAYEKDDIWQFRWGLNGKYISCIMRSKKLTVIDVEQEKTIYSLYVIDHEAQDPFRYLVGYNFVVPDEKITKVASIVEDECLHLLSWSCNGEVKKWDASTGKCIKTTKLGDAIISTSPSARYAVVCKEPDKPQEICDGVTGVLESVLADARNGVGNVLWSDNESWFISCIAQEKRPKMYNAATGKCIYQLPPLENVSLSADSRYLSAQRQFPTSGLAVLDLKYVLSMLASLENIQTLDTFKTLKTINDTVAQQGFCFLTEQQKSNLDEYSKEQNRHGNNAKASAIGAVTLLEAMQSMFGSQKEHDVVTQATTIVQKWTVPDKSRRKSATREQAVVHSPNAMQHDVRVLEDALGVYAKWRYRGENSQKVKDTLATLQKQLFGQHDTRRGGLYATS